MIATLCSNGMTGDAIAPVRMRRSFQMLEIAFRDRISVLRIPPVCCFDNQGP
ncbi:hypothetical protein [Rhizobium terrae]|uniref:hypothetical protein n=1 Tax=Rhizobium terrae TaxID=2171756 RepID=UPI0013C2CBD6|nr:hypothetical protein [Rhizobium terrae]